MLNKDQYNQEEYNNYYRQETEGAEISGGVEEESSAMGKIILLLLLLALLVAGYFGYQAFSSTQNDEIDTSLQVTAESSLPQSVQELQEEEAAPQVETKVETPKITVAEPEQAPQIQTVQTKEAPSESTQAKAVQNAVSTQVAKQEGKMSPEEIAAVVAAVMQQMNQQGTQDVTTPKPIVEKDDAKLMNTLSETEVDSVTSDLIKELESIDLSQDTQVNTTQKQVDVYNKVDVQDSTGSDALSQLSDQIDALTSEKVQKDQAASYTSSLQGEVSTRKNEMRVIVVKKGDTLGRIAKRAYGNVMEYKKIYKANPHVTRPDRIYVGQKLRIPN
jgi:nucleoid-associated protein YgaU